MRIGAYSTRVYLLGILLYLLTHEASSEVQKKQKADNVVAEMQVICQSDGIVLKLNTNTPFNGMVYAKDAPANSNCVAEYSSSMNMTFRLPLKSCGTLFAEADDGIEYFNTVVVQPHMRLMTNQGKGYHIRCKYQTRERTIANTHFNVSASFLMQNNQLASTTPLLATASMPSCTMKIFRSGREDVAETVKIGDKLIMVIEIDQQDMYGMKITNCVVRDGLNLAEQQLISDLGCPLDENIMPKFEYTNNSTRAAVSFPAHKFPHTSSVYYQCNVRLCINNGGCNQVDCNQSGASGSGSDGLRTKRFAGYNATGDPFKQTQSQSLAVKSAPYATSPPALPTASALTLPGPSSAGAKERNESDMSFDVYSGLYVNDWEIGQSGSSDRNAQQVIPSRHDSESGDSQAELCLSRGQAGLMMFVGSIATVGVIFMLVCQLGLVGRDQQVVGLTSARHSPIHRLQRNQRQLGRDRESRHPQPHPIHYDHEILDC